ncbi:MAG: rhomboid family intramembrane serine protease [Anaerolineae bacterium]
MRIPFPIATVGVMVFTLYWSYRGFTSPGFRDRYIFSPARILGNRQYYRLLSCGFLHLNWLHLLFNMFSLYSIGFAIELAFGFPTFLIIYLGSIVGGSLLSLYLHRNHHGYQALGASGGVCGVIFAYIFLSPPNTWIPFFFIPLPSWLFAILFILVSFFGLRNQLGGIGHDAHLGGAIIGLLITTALRPTIVVQRPVLYFVVIGLSVALFVHLYRVPLYVPGSNPFTPAYWRRKWREVQARRRAKQEWEDKETMDRLLTKISRSGMESLTAAEMRRLKAISKRMRESGRMH